MVQVQKSETILLPWLRRMGQIAQCWYSILRADILSDLTYESERLAQIIIIDVIYWGHTFFQISQTWVKDWPKWSLLIFYTEGRHSFRSHRREWKIGPVDSVFMITLFLCRWRLLWWQTFFHISQTWVKDWPKWYSFCHNIVSMQDALRCLLWRLYDSRWGLLWWMCFTARNCTLLIKYLCVTWCGS